jgi:quercetin dioxygenase-like cupin family protein
MRAVGLDAIERLDNDGLIWRPVRRQLGVTAFGVNGDTGAASGDVVIEPHDETSPNSGRHEELYLVLSGRATFTVDGEALDAPTGTFVLVQPGEQREAVATEPETTVLVVGGAPGAALPVSPFEYWYAAQPAFAAGAYEQAIAIASAGLIDHPESGGLRYQLACYCAMGGRGDEAVEHLRRAFAADPRTRAWAIDDADLDSLRARPDYPSEEAPQGAP